MKDLNLRTDYPEWDWNKDSNTEKAYSALINQGNTSLFKKTVWNDLVDCLYNALTEMGLTWDDSYGSYENTKFITNILLLNWIPMKFTAKMFNAVRYNIQKVTNSTFIWQYDKTYEGYVGRDEYKGYAETDNADTLYGSAIIELARKLNVLIRIFKDEANTKNGFFSMSIESISDSKLALPTINYSEANTSSEFSTSSNVSFCEPFDLGTRAVNESKSDAQMSLRSNASSFISKIKHYTHAEATMVLEELYRNLSSTIYHYATIKAKLTINYSNVRISAEVPNFFTLSSGMDFATVTNMLARNIAKTYVDVALTYSKPVDVNIDYLSTSLADAIVTLRGKRLLRLKLSSELEVEAELDQFKGSTFISITSHVTRIKTKASLVRTGNVNSQVSCRANLTIPELIKCVCNPMNAEYINCVLEIENSMNTGIANSIDSTISLTNSIESQMVKNQVAKIESNTIFNSLFNVELEKLLIRTINVSLIERESIESSLQSLEGLFQSSDIVSKFTDDIRLELYSSGETMMVREVFKLNNDSKLEALNYDDNYLKSRTINEVFFDSSLSGVRPYPLFINDLFESDNNAGMETLNAENTMKAERSAFETIVDTNMSIVRTGVIDVNIEHDALLSAELSFDPSSWHSPEQINNVLEVYQVYGISITGNKVSLE